MTNVNNTPNFNLMRCKDKNIKILEKTPNIRLKMGFIIVPLKIIMRS